MNKSLFSVKRATFSGSEIYFFPVLTMRQQLAPQLWNQSHFLDTAGLTERLTLFQEISVPNVLHEMWGFLPCLWTLAHIPTFRAFSKKLPWKRTSHRWLTLCFCHFSFNSKYSQLSWLPVCYFTNFVTMISLVTKVINRFVDIPVVLCSDSWILSVERINFQLEAKFWMITLNISPSLQVQPTVCSFWAELSNNPNPAAQSHVSVAWV